MFLVVGFSFFKLLANFGYIFFSILQCDFEIFNLFLFFFSIFIILLINFLQLLMSFSNLQSYLFLYFIWMLFANFKFFDHLYKFFFNNINNIFKITLDIYGSILLFIFICLIRKNIVDICVFC